ncbi:hypothetical protein LguiA_011739 [Lonicera macranthoides]
MEEDEEEVHHHPAAAAADGGILRSTRSVPPSDFVLKIESFSHLSSMRLWVYPDGNKKSGGEGYLSIYLALQVDNGSYNFPLGWEVNVYFKLFLYDQLRDNYTTIQVTKSFESAGWSTSAGPIKCGDLILLSELSDQSKGFLMNDTLVIGANYSVVCEVTNT